MQTASTCLDVVQFKKWSFFFFLQKVRIRHWGHSLEARQLSQPETPQWCSSTEKRGASFRDSGWSEEAGSSEDFSDEARALTAPPASGRTPRRLVGWCRQCSGWDVAHAACAGRTANLCWPRLDYCAPALWMDEEKKKMIVTMESFHDKD